MLAKRWTRFNYRRIYNVRIARKQNSRPSSVRLDGVLCVLFFCIWFPCCSCSWDVSVPTRRTRTRNRWCEVQIAPTCTTLFFCKKSCAQRVHRSGRDTFYLEASNTQHITALTPFTTSWYMNKFAHRVMLGLLIAYYSLLVFRVFPALLHGWFLTIYMYYVCIYEHANHVWGTICAKILLIRAAQICIGMKSIFHQVCNISRGCEQITCSLRVMCAIYIFFFYVFHFVCTFVARARPCSVCWLASGEHELEFVRALSACWKWVARVARVLYIICHEFVEQ